LSIERVFTSVTSLSSARGDVHVPSHEPVRAVTGRWCPAAGSCLDVRPAGRGLEAGFLEVERGNVKKIFRLRN
jgi:hypothetical protein